MEPATDLPLRAIVALLSMGGAETRLVGMDVGGMNDVGGSDI